jgi:hypothetical protein
MRRKNVVNSGQRSQDTWTNMLFELLFKPRAAKIGVKTSETDIGDFTITV